MAYLAPSLTVIDKFLIQSRKHAYCAYFVLERNIQILKPNQHVDSPTEHNYTTMPLMGLTPATEDEVRKLFNKSPNKTYELDPIPPSLLKDCTDQLLSLVSAIIYKSLMTCCVPHDLKSAQIKPILNGLTITQIVWETTDPYPTYHFC